MAKKLIISFPGSAGAEIPVQYYMVKHYEDMGYEKLFIANPDTGECTIEELFNVILKHADQIVQRIPFEEYADVVFVAKSMGTVVACELKERYHISASLILLTPIWETLPYLHGNNDIILVVAGDRDRHLDTNVLKGVCQREGIPCYIEEGVGHRMEVRNDLQRNLEIISQVVEQI